MRKSLVAVFILGALAVVFFAACGRKAPPVPPHFVIPRISDLQARVTGSDMVLTWTAPDQKTDVARTRILKSVLQVPEDCPGCPRSFDVLADLVPGDVKRENELAKFVDYNIKSGFLYSYKLVLCDSSGQCGEESNMAEARIKNE